MSFCWLVCPLGFGGLPVVSPLMAEVCPLSDAGPPPSGTVVDDEVTPSGDFEAECVELATCSVWLQEELLG